jgi:hypothetical protein
MNTPSLIALQALEELQQYSDPRAMTPALHNLCNKFGPVENLVIFTAKHEETTQAICFLKLTSEEHEQAMMASLGLGRFGGEVVIVVNLKQNDLTDELDDEVDGKVSQEYLAQMHMSSSYAGRQMAMHAG